jgi:hypothetical protein
VLKYPPVLSRRAAATAFMAGRLRALCQARGQWQADALTITPSLLAFFLRDFGDMVGGAYGALSHGTDESGRGARPPSRRQGGSAVLGRFGRFFQHICVSCCVSSESLFGTSIGFCWRGVRLCRATGVSST